MSSPEQGVQEKQMTSFTIDADNSITAFATKQEADGGQGDRFSKLHELGELAGKWPANRLVEVWNGIPGLTPVKKFTNRKSALARIWKAIQSLNGDSAADAASSAPKRPAKAGQAPKPVKKTARSAKNKPPKAAKGKRGKGAAKPAAARDGSKKSEVLALLQRKGGATLAQIMKATDWQAPRVRGFISTSLGKQKGLQVEAARRQDS